MIPSFDYRAPPTIAKFMRSNHPFRILVGPIGSGKTTGCFAEILRRCAEAPLRTNGQRRSRWGIVSSPMNGVPAQFIDMFSGLGTYYKSARRFELRVNDIYADVIFFVANSETDMLNFVNMEFTGCYLCGLDYSFDTIWQATLRSQRYPPRLQGPPQWGGVICETRKPAEGAPAYALVYGLPQESGGIIDAEVFWQPSGFSEEAENTENLAPGYYERVAAGHSKEWIERYIECKRRKGYGASTAKQNSLNTPVPPS